MELLHSSWSRSRFAFRHSRLLQIGMLLAFWWLGELAARLFDLPVPGGVVGMAAMLALLLTGVIHPAALRRGAGFLLAEMLLFFIPAVMALLDHREFLSPLGLKLAAVIFFGTMVVMIGTALTVDFCYRWSLRHAARR